MAGAPLTTGTAARSDFGTSWEWAKGDQPAFSPRHAPVPARVLDRLTSPSGQVILGWFHRYPARFAVDVITAMLAEVTTRARRPIATVLDPFCGTGAAISASRQLGLKATGIELTTLGVEIGKLRLDPPRNPWDAAAFCLRLAETAPATKPRVDERLAVWLGVPNARLLTAWLPVVAEVDDVRLRRFLTIAVSQSLRPSSRWLMGSIKATADPDRTPIPLDQSLRRWARQLARDCTVEQQAQAVGMFGEYRQFGQVQHGDARAIPIADASIDAIVTSPPYFVTYDYFDVQRLSYLAFDWPVQRASQIGTKYGHKRTESPVDFPPALRLWYEYQFRGERTTLGRALRTYVGNLRSHLAEAARIVAPGGVVAYSVANTIRAGRVFDLAEAFRQMLAEADFTDVEVVSRTQAGRRILPAGRDPLSGRFSGNTNSAGVREYIVFATRG